MYIPAGNKWSMNIRSMLFWITFHFSPFHCSVGSAPVIGAQCPLTSSLGEFLGYWDWLWYPGLSPVLVSIALPFAFHITVFSIHYSSPAIGFHSSIFHGGGICTPPPTPSLFQTGNMVIGYPKRLRYHGGGVESHGKIYLSTYARIGPLSKFKRNNSSGYTDSTRANKRIGQAWQKAAAWLLCDHMFLLCGRRPYVSIVWLSVSIVWVKSICYESYHLLKTICWLVPACLPSVSIVWVKNICFYCERQKHLVWVIPSVVGLCHPSPGQGRNLLALHNRIKLYWA